MIRLLSIILFFSAFAGFVSFPAIAEHEAAAEFSVPDDPRAAAIASAERLQELRDRRAALQRQIDKAEEAEADRLRQNKAFQRIEADLLELQRRVRKIESERRMEELRRIE